MIVMEFQCWITWDWTVLPILIFLICNFVLKTISLTFNGWTNHNVFAEPSCI
ncbi:uncharacterized protein DS421_5g156470 [Arachis hypogaea]|nr:uncharacterized protein DS421_5g156470 [Arachis hypogaea]